MLGKLLLKTSLVALVAGLAFTASPVATITSSQSFILRGSTVNPDGVPSWPVMAGDEIKTTGASARILFRDGSRVTLDASSAVRIEQTASSNVVRLSSGSMDVLARSAALQVYENSTAQSVIPGKLTKVSANASSVSKDPNGANSDVKAAARPRPVSAR